VLIKLVVDEHEVELSWEVLESLVSNLPDDNESFAGLLHCLAQSKIATVREAVARKGVISEDTVARLETDACPEVLEALVTCQQGKLTQAALTRIIQRDWSRVNRGIAESVESYLQCEVNSIANLLAASEDPSVRALLASNYSAPKAVLRTLLQDPDPVVRGKALRTLTR